MGSLALLIGVFLVWAGVIHLLLSALWKLIVKHEPGLALELWKGLFR